MKEFDLKAALNGEPVMLRGGNKAYIGYKTPDCYVYKNGEKTKFPLHGFIIAEDNKIEVTSVVWNINGRVYKDDVDDEFDIIGMWEEPKISIEDLPKPFKPQETESYYYINGGCIGYRNEYRYSNLFDRYAAENGNCFRTREGAEMWLKLMKGMME